MSFPRYPAYKDSGVEWLGEVPEHWNVMRLSRNLENMPCYGVLVPEYVDDGVPMLRINDIENGLASRDDLKKISTQLSDEYSRTLLEEGDIALAVVGTIGRSLIVDKQLVGCNLSRAVAKIRPGKNLSARMLRWIFESLSFRRYTDLLCVGTAQRVLNMSTLASFYVTVPSCQEQVSIVNFLERETAKIDTLIAEQQRLIELLQEKRQAVISHAVTKGLNPEVPMKDSGVEWLGEVPEHWEVQKVKHFCRHIEQGWSPQCENEASEGDAPGVLKVGCVNGGIFRAGENKRLPPDLSPIPEYSVRKGDLLISRANTKELVGSAAVVSEDYPWLFICVKLYRITVDPSLATASFLALYLGSSEVRGQVELGASGASQSMQNISQSVLMELPIALPDLVEQEAIRNTIANECCSIDELVAEGSRGIQLLQERRSALISAAVTGQIDVQGLVPEASAA